MVPARILTGVKRLAALVALLLVLVACDPSALLPTTMPVTDFAPTGPTQRAEVVRVVDGDTIIVALDGREQRLRYIGVDAPELVRPSFPIEFMGREASAANSALVDGRMVVLERDVSDTDRFGRLLRHVWLEQGGGWLLVSLELVEQGLANAVSFPPDVKYQEELRAAERAARSAGTGLWGVP